MASKVDVCNLALAKLAQDVPINSLTEATKAARLFNRIFDQKRDELLAMHPWPFALKAQALALDANEDPPPGWEYRYAYPSDCLLALAVTDEDGVRASLARVTSIWNQDDSWHLRNGYVAFEVQYGSQATSIVSDLDTAYLIYVVRHDTTSRWPPLFVNALACLLALEAAPALAGETGLRMAPSLRQAFEGARADAIAAGFNESHETVQPITPALAARL